MADVTTANQVAASVVPSVPASSAWTVTSTKRANESRCTACHRRRGRYRMRSDVASIANSR